MKRFLTYEGRNGGSVPEDYALFKAAQWLGVPPWELAERPIYWKDRALFFMRAENEARASRAEIDRQAASRKRG